ncbi:MAG: hypothetical protein M1823_001991 [Watsoniomyces obsoletus]|nr:MAG: hypothetical protein M1823_001991 [Watsoniomyces obsoletus]
MIKSRFARRKALNIRRNEDEDEDSKSAEQSSDQADDQDDGPVVKRPLLVPRGSNRAKKSSSLRLSFGPGESPSGENAGSEEFTPKKSRLSREALERSASLARSAKLPSRDTPGEERPSYSKEYLDELRSATPSAPRSPKSNSALIEHNGRTSSQALDVVAKFGLQASISTINPAIPSEAEIREKKERRARLAREQEYIGLDNEDDDDEDEDDEERRYRDDDDDDDDNPHREMTFRTRPTKWTQETRLVRDDEDLAEGFDEFVEDNPSGNTNKILLGKQAELQQKRQARETMRQMIEEAEGGGHRQREGPEEDEESSDESEAERRAAYEEAQTRAGTNRTVLRSTLTAQQQRQRPTTPPRITPIPSLEACISRLETTLQEKQMSRQQKIDKLQEIARRKIEVVQRQSEIQKLLEEASLTYERLRAEAGLKATGGKGNGVSAEERGLENLGNMQMNRGGSPMDQD